ncbi:MAG: hypothetical protein HQ536_05310 [Parcubacteria group bacterium]|nr:hypothetical protein [Parcubacteria group bacterium]
MEKLCEYCKEGTEEERRFFPIHQECRLTITAAKEECFDCAKERYIKSIELAEAENIVIIKKGRLLIDWNLFLSASHEKEKYRRWYYDELIDILLSLEFFSFKSNNCFEIFDTSHGYSMNPRHITGRILYFTRDIDVREYVRLEIFKEEYDWEVRSIGHVYTKKFLMGKK